MNQDDPLRTIDLLAEDYRAARTRLADLIAALQDEIEAAKRRRLPEIRATVAQVADARAALEQAVADSPRELWSRPRTRTLHGVRVGWATQKGRLVWDDTADLVQAVRRRLPDRADELIRTREEPVRTALARLDPKTLAQLGVRIEGAGDTIIVRDAIGELDRLIDALLGDTLKETAI